MVYAFWHVEESTWVTLNLADVQKRRDKLKVGPTHEKVWAALRWHENSQEERSWHMGRQETRWKEFRCEVWRVQCDVWGHGLDSNTATASHKARTHGPGWHTAHASSLVVLGSDSWKLRWHMRRDEVRRDELGWGEKSSDEMKGAVWSVGQEECSVKCEVWSVKCEMWSVECEVWSVECKECSVKCGVWSAKWSFKCDMWNRTPPSQSARTHRLGWRTAHASSIDEKGLIYIFKATSAPPRAGTTGKHIYNL